MEKIDSKMAGNKEKYDIIVIGAGASGLMAAITSARNGKKVLIVEQKDKIGKKLFATGNGKCNFTNEYMELSCFHGDKELIEETLGQFSKENCLSFFRELGIYPKNKNGYYYPNSEQASSMVYALELELNRLQIKVSLSEKVEQISKSKQGFQVQLCQEIAISRKIVLATGLLASPKLGSDGTLFPYIKSMGHHFSPIVPSLCGFCAKGIPFQKVAGVRAEADISLYVNDSKMESDHGEMQFAEYGISGIPVFQISRTASLALYEKKQCRVRINFLPCFTDQMLKKELQNRSMQSANWKTADMLNGLLNHKLIGVLLGYARISPTKIANKLTRKELENLYLAITALELVLVKPRDFEFAQICAGGIHTEEIEKHTLESKLVPDLYFAGELLDVDGICGGYNLQWAWSSGYVAGLSASRIE